MNRVRASSLSMFTCLATCLMPLAHADEKLGRLFLTPERRMVLEQQRQFNIQEQETLQGSTVALDGVVVRSSGKKTVWINGRAQNDGSGGLGINAKIAHDNPGQAGIEVGDGANTRLRVGQKINRATREVSDGLDGGRLEVNPSPRQR